MFIQTEHTPNPQTLKFIPGQDVMETGTLSINRADKGKSPLADRLFENPDIESLFFGGDFISVTKNPNANWDTLKPEILTLIMENFVAEIPLLNEGNSSLEIKEDDNELVATIKELIETRVRPAVAEDGGDIIYHDFKDGIVYLEMHGACAGCPSSTVTLKDGIENLLQHYIPEVESVESI